MHLFKFKLKFITIIISFIIFIIIPKLAYAQNSLDFQSASDNSKVLIQIFERDDCTHCKDLKAFLTELKTRRNDFEIIKYDIYKPENNRLWSNLTKLKNLPKVTPIILIGNNVMQGFSTPETSGIEIEKLIDQNKGLKQFTIEDYIKQGGGKVHKVVGGTCDNECVVEDTPFLVEIPFWGPTNVKQFSLPIMSAVLGFIDGFNPCAMWVLVTFLIVLVQIGNKKKMWLFAGVFILAEAIMYTLILTVWFSTWDFVGLDRFVTPIVGLISMGGGLFFLYEYWSARKSDAIECKVGNIEQKQKTTTKLKNLATQKFTLLTLLGIIGLAFSVNVIEFACSIGIPQAFTKILELNNFSLINSLQYIFVYIIFYMMDDIIVFGIALWSFDKIGITSKYTKWSNLVGGVLMLILGALLIFNPSLLTL